MKRQNSCGPHWDKLVFQLPGVVTFAYDLCFRHVIARWKGILERYTLCHQDLTLYIYFQITLVYVLGYIWWCIYHLPHHWMFHNRLVIARPFNMDMYNNWWLMYNDYTLHPCYANGFFGSVNNTFFWIFPSIWCNNWKVVKFFNDHKCSKC